MAFLATAFLVHQGSDEQQIAVTFPSLMAWQVPLPFSSKSPRPVETILLHMHVAPTSLSLQAEPGNALILEFCCFKAFAFAFQDKARKIASAAKKCECRISANGIRADVRSKNCLLRCIS